MRFEGNKFIALSHSYIHLPNGNHIPLLIN